jgi:hypothetical protein
LYVEPVSNVAREMTQLFVAGEKVKMDLTKDVEVEEDWVV